MHIILRVFIFNLNPDRYLQLFGKIILKSSITHLYKNYLSICKDTRFITGFLALKLPYEKFIFVLLTYFHFFIYIFFVYIFAHNG